MQKNVSLENVKLGWVGLGVMGEPMCHHLLTAGYPMSVTTRSKEKSDRLCRGGARWCQTPADVAEASDVIFTMVGSAQEVQNVYYAENGLFSRTIGDKVFIDMGTTAPKLTQDISQSALELGAQTIDAPVSGGDVGARDASLSIMAGGDDDTLHRLSDVFSHLGKVRVMGGPGSGQHAKMCNQIVVAGTMIGVCESLVYAKRAGLDCVTLIEAISSGAAGCWTLDNLAPRIIQQDYSSGFMVNHFVKDLAIAVSEAEAMNLELPGLSLAKSLYEKVQSMGHGKSAMQALMLAVESEGS